METTSLPRSRVNLTLPENLVKEARAHGLNLSGAAEAGIASALKRAKEAVWLEDNAEAIAVYNAWRRKRGPLLKPVWMKD